MDDKELENGYHLVSQNAESLINESKFLLDNGFFARAYTLAQLAIEEVGKCSILCNAILRFYHGEEINIKFFKEKGFFDHKEKTKASFISEYTAIWMYEKSIGEKTNLRNEVLNDYQNLSALNNFKNHSLYVGVQDDKFISPLNAIDKDMATAILKKAHLRLTAERGSFRSLDQMKVSADAILEIESDPEKKKEIAKKLKEEFGVEL